MVRLAQGDRQDMVRLAQVDREAMTAQAVARSQHTAARSLVPTSQAMAVPQAQQTILGVRLAQAMAHLHPLRATLVAQVTLAQRATDPLALVQATLAVTGQLVAAAQAMARVTGQVVRLRARAWGLQTCQVATAVQIGQE